MESLIFLVFGGIVFLAAAGTAVYFICRAVRSVRNAANSMAGQVAAKIAEEILDGNAEDLEANLSASRPRSISDMTSVYEPAIARDFPDLNLRQLISSAENILCAALSAIQAGSSDESESRMDEDAVFPRGNSEHQLLGVTGDFAALVRRRTDALLSAGTTEYFEQIRVHRTGIHAYVRNAGTCVITLQTAIEYLHYVKQNGIVVSGNQQIPEQARYNLELIYVQNEDLLASSETNAVGVTCPNCGAPVAGLGRRQCEYCGSALRTVDIRIWRMNKFNER